MEEIFIKFLDTDTGERTIIRRTKEEDSITIYDMQEYFLDFLRGMGYSDSSISEIMKIK